MSVELVKEFSDTNYPFANSITIKYPYEPEGRNVQKQGILELLELIDATNYKIIENFRSFEVLLRHEIDDVHFDQVAYEDPDDPIEIDIFLPERKAKHTSNLWKLKNCFKRTLAETGMDSNIRVRIDPQERCVSVSAKTLSEYMVFWRAVPESGRRKLMESQP